MLASENFCCARGVWGEGIGEDGWCCATVVLGVVGVDYS